MSQQCLWVQTLARRSVASQLQRSVKPFLDVASQMLTVYAVRGLRRQLLRAKERQDIIQKVLSGPLWNSGKQSTGKAHSNAHSGEG